MGRKQKVKAKGRLDEYYKSAKQAGFRSRAAYKLIQLNKKFQFMNNAQVCIDLCSAPGGWLQVANHLMPINSIKIGIDLVPIRHIANCKTFVADITTQHCFSLIKKEIKGQKADVVLNDGAPNVGANWNKDAFTQNELALSACQLATQVLRKGGSFVTKVFRSSDYQSLIWVFNKFFKQVHATKPEASRQVSAEIFVVCQDYIAPDFIDKNFFDLKYVFQDTERDIIEKYHDNTINSLTQLFKKKRNRGGYADDVPQNMHLKLDLSKFIELENPYPTFFQYNEITIDSEAKEKYLPLQPLPPEFEEMFTDIKILGKKEVSDIIKWKEKINKKLEKKQLREKDAENKTTEKTTTKMEIESEDELEQEIKKIEHIKLNESRKEREKKISQLQKHKVLQDLSKNQTTYDDQELFDYSQHKQLLNQDYVELDYERDSNQEIQQNKAKYKQTSFSEMNDNIEYLYQEKLNRRSKIKELQKEKNAKEELKQWRYDHIEQKVKAGRFQPKLEYPNQDNKNDQEEEEKTNKKQKNKKEVEYEEDVDEDDEDENFEGEQDVDEDDEDENFEGEEDEDEEEENEDELEEENDEDDEDEDDEEDNFENEDDEEEIDEEDENEADDEEEVDDEDDEQQYGEEYETFQQQLQKKGSKSKKTENKGNNQDRLNINEDNKNKIKSILNKKMFDKQLFHDLEDELEMEVQRSNFKKQKVLNKQIKKENKKLKKSGAEIENDDDDNQSNWSNETEKEEEYALKIPKTDMEKRKQKLKHTKKKSQKKIDTDKDIQIVKNKGYQAQEDNYDENYESSSDEDEQEDPEFKKKFEDYDIDELASNLALAKKMLRKKTREKILNESYSRIAYDEDEDLPQWFIDDEAKHNYKMVPISKDDFESEKAQLLSVNYKTPKKILEAQWRKKRKLTKKLKKAQKQAEHIINEDSLTEPQKMVRIHNLYQKARNQAKTKKKYVVGQKFKSSGPTASKLVKAVDARMKKDAKYQKLKDKGKRSKKIKKSKKRQTRRHK